MGRLERLNLKKASSMAKVIGTVITLGGAMVMTLFKGPIVNLIPHPHGGIHHAEAAGAAGAPNWVTGTICLIACIVGWAGFFIVQVTTFTHPNNT